MLSDSKENENKHDNNNENEKNETSDNSGFGISIESRCMPKTYGICIRESIKDFKKRHGKKFAMSNNRNKRRNVTTLIHGSNDDDNNNNNNNNDSDNDSDSVDDEKMEQLVVTATPGINFSSEMTLTDEMLQEYRVYDEELKEDFIVDVFHPFVRKGDKIKTNSKITEYVTPADIRTRVIYIDLYASDERDPIFVKGKPIAGKEFTLLDSWIKQNNNNKFDIPIDFVFGDTQIHVRVGIDGIPENQRELRLNFDLNAIDQNKNEYYYNDNNNEDNFNENKTINKRTKQVKKIDKSKMVIENQFD